MAGVVRDALEVTLSSDASLSHPRYAALVSLCRVFADQVDAAGDEVSSRLTAAYLSALKDLDRALATSKASGAGAGTAGERGADRVGKLARLQSIAGGKAASAG